VTRAVVLALLGQSLLTALGQQVSGWFGTLHVVNGVVIGAPASGCCRESRRQHLRQQQG
jgi:hypothetical protein